MIRAETEEQTKAPPIVYKYVTLGRTEVLSNAEIRFTPPLNTNDIFEVRQTFEMLVGPKMKQIFTDQTAAFDLSGMLAKVLPNTPFANTSVAAFRKIFTEANGQSVEEFLQEGLQKTLSNQIYPFLNSQDSMNYMLNELSNKLICLSLSERFDISPMWAHYAGNSTGFVIAFDTENEFFKRGNPSERQGLQKIAYFDGKISEMLDDPYAALMSKQLDWAYEREWRLYLATNQASRNTETATETIHLVDFPRGAVQRVILGLRASCGLESSIRSILSSGYPNAQLTKIHIDDSTASLIERPLE